MGEGGPGLVRRAPFLGLFVALYLATASLAFPAESFAQSRGTSKKPHSTISLVDPGQGPQLIPSCLGSYTAIRLSPQTRLGLEMRGLTNRL